MEEFKSTIEHSGNSDVDVTVKIDTTSIAYAMLCSLLATKLLTNEEFEVAVQKLMELTGHKQVPVRVENNVSNVHLYDKNKRKNNRRRI